MLVIANEDYTGVNPDYPASVTSPKYDELHVAAIRAAGYDVDVWDVDRQGVPHDLGVLSHYDGLVWYQGDDRLPQDPEDELTSTPLGPLPDMSVKESQQYLTMAVRDYLNEGGKLVHSSETAQFTGLPGFSNAVGGLYYGLNGDPEAECVISPRPNGGIDGFFEDCLILADDFRQYYLGGVLPHARGHAAGVHRASPTRSTGRPATSLPATIRSTRRGRTCRPATSCRSTSSRSSPARVRPSTASSRRRTRSCRSRVSGTSGCCTATRRTPG